MWLTYYRCIGVYFPSKLKSKRFRCYSKLVLVLAWLLAYVPLTPGLFGMNGLYGLECKTRKCTVININYWDESPTSLNPKEKLGSNTFIMAGICLVIVNALIYYRLWVRWDFNSINFIYFWSDTNKLQLLIKPSLILCTYFSK